MELSSIVIGRAVDSVLASVEPDDSLSAFEGLSLASDSAYAPVVAVAMTEPEPVTVAPVV